MAAVPSIPPKPIVSTAEEGTMTIDPFVQHIHGAQVQCGGVVLIDLGRLCELR